ncbi:MAG TPA: signal peptide peptidase SppA [Labilithrix sp.]|nr:signal peptide peptidase SppA [Labilithrix sp.]
MIVLRLIGLLFDLILLPLRLLLRGRVVPRDTWLTITVDGPVVDIAGKPRFWQLRAQKALSLHVLDSVVTAMLGDPRVRGLCVTLRSMSGGMASATSLRAILARARAGGKEVVVHLPMGGDTKEVYVATAANKVLLGPTAQLVPLGFRSATRYLKRVLDRAGIQPQVFACGEFKSAGESLVRDSMSPEQRLQLEALLDTFHDALIDGIATGRGISRERATDLVDAAPYFGPEAVAKGLADDLAYEDEVPEKLGVPRRRARSWSVDAGAYLAAVERPLLRSLIPPPVLSVIPVHGAIAHAAGPFEELSTDERVIRMVRAARRDRRVRGVILHVDSPGGSALASDLMHHEIAQLAREKPVVACMANVAASGGYYVAAPAACIVAQSTTVTGSIGVVAARVSIDALLARLGITTEIIERGKNASLLSPTGDLDDAARATIERELAATYRAFIGVVAAGRKMADDEVERLARGRVYTGHAAHDVKLVDVVGGFDLAIEELRRRLHTRIRDRAVVKLARTPRQPLAVPTPPKDKEAARHAAAALFTALLPPRERVLVELALAGERVLAMAPIAET